MLGHRLPIVLAGLCWPLLNVALAQDDAKPPPQSLPSEQARPVKVLHLSHAAADSLAQELSVLFRDEVRIIADKRTNSLIVTAPAAMQDTVVRLITKLDAPPTPGEARPSDGKTSSGTGMEVVPLRGANSDMITKAVDGLLAARHPRDDGTTVAVIKASRAAQRALEVILPSAVLSPPQAVPSPSGQQVPREPRAPPPSKPLATSGSSAGAPGGQSVRVKVIRLSGEEATAVDRALTQALAARGRKLNVVIANPPQPTGAAAPGDGSETKPR